MPSPQVPLTLPCKEPVIHLSHTVSNRYRWSVFFYCRLVCLPASDSIACVLFFFSLFRLLFFFFSFLFESSLSLFSYLLFFFSPVLFCLSSLPVFSPLFIHHLFFSSPFAAASLMDCGGCLASACLTCPLLSGSQHCAPSHCTAHRQKTAVLARLVSERVTE